MLPFNLTIGFTVLSCHTCLVLVLGRPDYKSPLTISNCLVQSIIISLDDTYIIYEAGGPSKHVLQTSTSLKLS